MKNRFRNPKERRFRISGPVLTAVLTLCVFAFFLRAIVITGEDVSQREGENLKQALEQSVVICYALEGSYPESLQYLKDHYGISWNEERYLVDFEVIGSNLPPDITVISRKG